LDLAHRNHDEVMRRGAKLNDQVGKITGAALHLGEEEEGGAPPILKSVASDGS
jgi:flavin reductase (DIM6/NTAB) family NADH-FMN oxidoreductase RutF